MSDDNAGTPPNHAIEETVHSNENLDALKDAEYEAKYVPDSYGEELGDTARVWRVYNDHSQSADTETVKGLNGTLDVLLVFAGLFSAVITASLVYEMTRIQRAIAAGTPAQDVPEAMLSFGSETYAVTDLWVNGLWLTSLILSLLTALVSVLAKQWIQHFILPVGVSPRSQTLIRQYRRWGFERWNVPFIIECLPVLLTVALLLFFAGLAVYVAPMNRTLFFVIVGFSSAIGAMYAAAVILPIVIPHCAYKTPISNYILVILDALIFLITRLFTIVNDYRTGVRTVRHPFWSVERRIHVPDLGAREEADVYGRFEFLVAHALRWLSLTCSEPSAGGQHNLFRGIEFLQDFIAAAPRKSLLDQAGTVERLGRASLHVAVGNRVTLDWDLWNHLFARRSEMAFPQLDAVLRVLMIARLCRRKDALRDRHAVCRALDALDTSTLALSDLRLHPIVWCELDRALRLGLVLFGDQRASTLAEMERVGLDHQSKFLIVRSWVEGAEGRFEWARPYREGVFDDTAMSLDEFEEDDNWSVGVERMEEEMDALRQILVQRHHRTGADLDTDSIRVEGLDGTNNDRRVPHGGDAFDGVDAFDGGVQNVGGAMGTVISGGERVSATELGDAELNKVGV
ncbi:hypothetical protein HDZ31DRAFT_65474 [Schizophyllum fasciatum]